MDYKLWLRRWTLRTLRKLLDLADDRLHAAEVNLREELSNVPGTHKRPRAASPGLFSDKPGHASPENRDSFGRSSEPLSVPGRLLKALRRRGVTASAFD